MKRSSYNSIDSVQLRTGGGGSAIDIGVKEYKTVANPEGGTLNLLFLCADSVDKVKSSICKRAKDFARGMMVRHGKDVKDMSGLRPEEHLITAFAESYCSGGKAAMLSMLSQAEEEHVIQEACDGCSKTNLFKFFNVRKDEVYRRLSETKPDIFHFSGHNNKGAGLVLVADDNSKAGVYVKSAYMKCNEMIECFQKLGHQITLAIIASCNSCEFAESLVECGIAKVAIGSQNSVYDTDMIEFVKVFYNKLLEKGRLPEDRFIGLIQEAFAIASKDVSLTRCNMSIYPKPTKICIPSSHKGNELTPIVMPKTNGQGVCNEYLGVQQ